MSIKHDHTLNPVTALEIYRSHSASDTIVLVGEGCFLKVLIAETGQVLRQLKIFEDQAIHGIAAQKPLPEGIDDVLDVAIWGGPYLAVFTRRSFKMLLTDPINRFSSLEGVYFPLSTAKASDWILNGFVSCHNHCFLVTAHNTILRGSTENGSLVLETLQSPSRSILYSAHLAYESINSVLVAAGTVFGEIIVWRCLHDKVSSESIVLHTFKGHEGSIFGVNISENVYDRNGRRRRLLASCSDDRTIRIWEMSLRRGKDCGLPQLATGTAHVFGAKSDEIEDKEEGAPDGRSLAVVMGHSSRIWSVQLLLAESRIDVLSFGEDATTQHWNLENSGYSLSKPKPSFTPNEDNQVKLLHQNTFAFNAGKHIWSRVVNSSDYRSVQVATGGADGKISLFKLPFEVSRSRSWYLQEAIQNLLLSTVAETDRSTEVDFERAGYAKAIDSLDEVETFIDHNARPIASMDKSINKLKAFPKKHLKDAFNKYAFISQNQVLVTTTFGRILIGKIDVTVEWTEVNMPAGRNDLRSYSIVKSIPELGVAFLGSANGTIFLYRSGSVTDFGKIHGKVADIFAIGKVDTQFLATTLGGLFATLFKFSIDEEHSDSQTRQLKLLQKFVVTSVGIVTRRLVLGSRFGVLAVYDEKLEEPACSWSSIHVGDAVTSVVALPHSLGHFLTTNRNGSYSIFSLTDSLSMVHQGTPPFGPMIELGWFSGTDLILYGFKSKNFIVWNETKQYEVSSVECGGAHRSYAYLPLDGCEGAGNFIYTKASKMYLHSQSELSHQIVKDGGHGREIKACAVSPKDLIATGAEDTAIRIWKYQDEEPPSRKQFNCLAVVQKHTTGVQHLRWHGSSYLFSSGGNEEFFVWALTEVEGFGTGIVCEASCPDQTEEQDLRIMSFDISSLAISTDGSETILISLAYSDSTIRSYAYSRAEKFILISEGQYKSSCLTQLRHLEVGVDLSFLTAGTDGCLTVWKAPLSTTSATAGSPGGSQTRNKLTILTNHKLHQSSIKTIDIVTKSSKIIVATGGDDNAISITVYDARDLKKKPRSMLVMSAHAAAITGISFVPNFASESSEKLRMVSSSNDQRVKEWELFMSNQAVALTDSLRKEGLHIKTVADIFTSVADIGDMAIFKTKEKPKKILIVGNGMEVYELL